MSSRSPTRFLAPLALLAAVLTIFLVTRSELGSPSESSGERARPAATGTDAKARPKRPSRTSTASEASGARTYTVKPGDVLGGISQSTGVPVADLLEYNGLDDAQSLSVGQKLKLTP